MSDLWKKFTNKNRFEDEEDDEITEDPEQEEAPAAPAASSFGKSTGASALELKVVRPETYDAVGKIADHLLNRRTVVLNLEATNKETAKRLIDFLSGVAYSINGNIRRVATNTFVITPSNVGITGEGLGTEEAPKASAKQEPANDFSF